MSQYLPHNNPDKAQIWDKYFSRSNFFLPALIWMQKKVLMPKFTKSVSAFINDGDKVMEAGCGTAMNTIHLAQTRAVKSYGLDMAPEALSRARVIADRENANIKLIKGKIENLTFPDNYFDMVWNHGVLEHYDEPLSVVDQMARVSNRVFIAVPRKTLMRKFLQKIKIIVGFTPDDIFHWYTEDDLVKMVDKSDHLTIRDHGSFNALGVFSWTWVCADKINSSSNKNNSQPNTASNKVVLIYPKSGLWEKLSIRLPLSLLHVAAVLIKEGFDVTFIDQRVDDDWEKKLLAALAENPLFVGVSSMTGTQIHHALKISELVKKNSTAPTIWGGVHVTLLPEQTLNHPLVDIGVLGEGELTIVELAHALQQNQPLNDIKGVIFKDSNGDLIKNERREMIKDLDILPELPYHLIDLSQYNSFDYQGEKSLDISTSRGCPFLCYFCYNTIFNHNRWRAHSANWIIMEMKKFIEKYQVKNVFFSR